MTQQLSEEILETAPKHPTGEVVHYIRHKAVIREQAEANKLRIVYDASARASSENPSLIAGKLDHHCNHCCIMYC